MPESYILLLVLLPVFLFSLCVHEWAHAWVASRCGDPTPKAEGRLSILPWRHWDLIGTIILPCACYLSGMPAFGWAKPVPVDARHFKNPRRDMALVAAAGPFSNLVLAALSALFVSFVHSGEWLDRVPMFVASSFTVLEMALVMNIQANLALAVFNLIPFPPLDGFMILQAALPPNWTMRLYKLAPYSFGILVALWATGGLAYLGVPVRWCFETLMQLAVT